MPIINEEYKIDNNERALISKLLESDPHEDVWGSDALEGFRRNVRNHYRRVQNGLCAYCRERISAVSAANCQIDHIAPKSRYASFTFVSKNLCVVCADCNQIKSNYKALDVAEDDIIKREPVRYPQTSERFMIIHPHFDDYERHIKKLKKLYVGKTKKGHRTIEVCDLNRFFVEFGLDNIDYLCDVNLLMSKFLDSDNPYEKRQLMEEIIGSCMGGLG